MIDNTKKYTNVFIRSFFTCVGVLFLGICNLQAQKLAPMANDDGYTLGFNLTHNISATNGLLINDTDANGSGTIAVQTTPIVNPSNGTLSLAADGSFTYTPNPGFVGTDSFTYRVCDDGTPNDVVSRFDFDDSNLALASVGPDATSVHASAAQTGCGMHFPSGAGGSTGFDVDIPNTGGIFDFTSFSVSFEYQDQESTADIVTAGNFRIYHITGNQIGIRVDVINGSTGLPDSFTLRLGNFVNNSNVLYSVAYDEITGDVTYISNGTTTVFTLAPAYSPLNTALASNIIIGRFMDGSGSSLPSLCSMEFVDESRLCDDAVVTLNVTASVITNRRITYRVKN